MGCEDGIRDRSGREVFSISSTRDVGDTHPGILFCTSVLEIPLNNLYDGAASSGTSCDGTSMDPSSPPPDLWIRRNEYRLTVGCYMSVLYKCTKYVRGPKGGNRVPFKTGRSNVRGVA